MANEVFISYSRKDYAKVIKTIKILDKELGINCWMDMEGIESGERFKDVIISAINSHQIILFMMTANSMNSKWALKELNFAENKKKRIVLVDIDHTPMTDAFMFDYGNKDVIDWDNIIQRKKLIDNLRKWIGKKQVKKDDTGADSRHEDNPLTIKKQAKPNISLTISRKEVKEAFKSSKLEDDDRGEQIDTHIAKILTKSAKKLCSLGLYQQALPLFEQAGEHGGAEALYELGNCHYYGHGVMPDKQKALELYKKASVKGIWRAKERVKEIQNLLEGNKS